jgi:hypothetical protein
MRFDKRKEIKEKKLAYTYNGGQNGENAAESGD